VRAAILRGLRGARSDRTFPAFAGAAAVVRHETAESELRPHLALDKDSLVPRPVAAPDAAIVAIPRLVKPSTLLRLHRALITRKYRLLFSTKAGGLHHPYERRAG